jgi:hypothetical protein
LYASCLAPHCEHVVCQVVFVVFPPVLLSEDKVNEKPHALNGIGVGPSVRIHEVDAVVHTDSHCLVNEKVCEKESVQPTVIPPLLTSL